MLMLFGTAYEVLNHYRFKENPAWAAVGMDNPTFLSNIAMAAEEQWDSYNTDKRLLWSQLCVYLARIADLPYHEAAQWVSFLSIAALIPLTYLTGLPLLGRLAAFLAALLTLSSPDLHPFAIQSTSYAFFFATVLFALAAGVWMLTTRAAWLYALTGIATALCLATQIKGITLAVPIIGLGLLASIKTGVRGMVWRIALLLLPLGINQILIERAPVRYTGMGKLTAIHRFAVHNTMHYQWPAVKKPDLSNPSPLSKWLPLWLRGGEFEAFLAVTMSPPDSNVIVFEPASRDQGAELKPRIMKETSIPPMNMRLKHNLKTMQPDFQQTWPVLLTLLGIGLFFFSLPLPKSMQQRSLLAGWLIVAALASLFGTFALKYIIRYVAFAIPLAAIGITAGIVILAQQWTRFRGFWRLGTNLIIVWFTLSVALMIVTRSGTAYLSRGLSLSRIESYLQTPRLRPRIQQSEGFLMVADWLRTNTGPDDHIVDCSPIPIWVYLAGDPRLVSFKGGESPRQVRCLRLLAEEHVPSNIYIVTSDVMEHRAPSTPSNTFFFDRPDVWEPVFRVNTRTHDTSMPPLPYRSDPGDVVVFRGLGREMTERDAVEQKELEIKSGASRQL